MIFLDTHVLVWLYEGLLKKFPQSTRQKLEENDLFISPIVELELSFLYEIQRITVPSSKIIRELDARISLNVSRIDFYRVTEEAHALNWTRDPFDRLIVAHAQIFQAPFITKDKTIHKHYDKAFWD